MKKAEMRAMLDVDDETFDTLWRGYYVGQMQAAEDFVRWIFKKGFSICKKYLTEKGWDIANIRDEDVHRLVFEFTEEQKGEIL